MNVIGQKEINSLVASKSLFIVSRWYTVNTSKQFFHYFIFSAKLRRVKDNEYPLLICLSWDAENAHNHRLVLQENETGEIDVSPCLNCCKLILYLTIFLEILSRFSYKPKESSVYLSTDLNLLWPNLCQSFGCEQSAF